MHKRSWAFGVGLLVYAVTTFAADVAGAVTGAAAGAPPPPTGTPAAAPGGPPGGPPGGAPGGPPPGGGPPPPARGPALEVAVAGVQAAIAACAAQGLKVTAVVADSSGALKAGMVSDGVNGMTARFALGKIAVAVNFRKPSGEVGAQAKTDADLAARLKANADFVPWPGAVPLMVGDELVGALAVSGASGEQDEACARAAVEKIRAQLK